MIDRIWTPDCIKRNVGLTSKPKNLTSPKNGDLAIYYTYHTYKLPTQACPMCQIGRTFLKQSKEFLYMSSPMKEPVRWFCILVLTRSIG